MQIVVFTDGASRGNPGPGGWGAIVATEEKVEELGGAQKRTTNNRMELMAAIQALRYAQNIRHDSMAIYSDSSYVINGATKWLHGWKKNNWKTKEKSDVLNRDLWEALSQLIAPRKNISWHKVGGHVSIPGNERADEIATRFADGKKIELYAGSRKGYAHDLARIAHDEARGKEKEERTSRSRAKAYSYVSRVGGKIMVHKTWDECRRRVEGKPALYKKSLSPEDEAAIIRDFERSGKMPP